MAGSGANDASRAQELESKRSILKLTGLLLVGGFLLNLIATVFHPSGSEDDHNAIFSKYSDSDAWITIHLGQFIGVLIALAGLLVLYRVLTLGGEAPLLARFAAGATIATAATWAVLQAVDGVALKQAVDAWTEASGTGKAIRFADAETVRWVEWGVQSYFRVLLALTFVLFGATILMTRVVASWLGWIAVFMGSLSAAIGIDVGFNGLESGLQDVAGIAFLLAVVVFAVGISVTRGRRRDLQSAPRS
jgi:uncharacterized BrkB/YihY/UPF0761 family membrane protein